MMAAYYNEFDPFAASQLRRLISEGKIPAGDVDTRSISNVQPDDLRGYTQYHFFAGVGGWCEALRIAGVPPDYPLFTGSCPCQPFSIAGKRHGYDDERHLWPDFFRLIAAVRPPLILGEQVVSLGWWDNVANDLEGYGYATRAQIRTHLIQRRRRLFWVASIGSQGRERLVSSQGSRVAGSWEWRGKADLQIIADAPFERTDRWPQPLLRRLDDGVSKRVDRLRCFGNAIVPPVAAAFIVDVFTNERTQPC